LAPSPAPATVSESESLLDLEAPHFLPVGDVPLYAVWHGVEGPPPGRVVVHVHGLGIEHLTSYRNHVRLARGAAALGTPVLRYHARGHGDSGGDFADVTLEGLVEDALAAAAAARERAGGRGVVWFGDRLGGLVAARALARDRAAGGQAVGLVLWEPVHRPLDDIRAMLRGVLFSQVAHGRRPGATVEQLLERMAAEGTLDVHGYLLHRTFVDSAREASLEAALAGWSGPTLLVQVQGRARLATPHAALARALEARGARVTTRLVQEEPGWHFIANPAWESEALVAHTVEWLRELA
jgi:uncharacterized protein